MANFPPKPTPLVMNRIQNIPKRPVVYLEQKSAFSSKIPSRGWGDAWAYLDTGIMYSTSARLTCLNAFMIHYEGRLFVVSAVAGEVRRAADPANSARIEGAVQNAARIARSRFLDSGAVVVDDGDPDSKVFDEVYRQLSQLPKPAGEVRHERANVGEAFTIAMCIKHRHKGRRLVFLTNDGGASVVATFHEVPTRHFGHILRELVCAGHISFEDAFEALTTAQRISGIPQDDVPKSPDELACNASGQTCARCDPLD